MRKHTTAQRLKQVMQDQNLRQVDILRKSLPFQKELGIKMSKSHLSRYVNGSSNPHQNSIYLLSKTLNVNEGWLMGYDVDMRRPLDEVYTNEKTSLQEKSPNSLDAFDLTERFIVNTQLYGSDARKNFLRKLGEIDTLDDDDFDYLSLQIDFVKQRKST